MKAKENFWIDFSVNPMVPGAAQSPSKLMDRAVPSPSDKEWSLAPERSC
jgi:hypothetical protein